MEQRRRYNTLMGDNPPPRKQVSDKQLSALSIVVAAGVCPFIDMGVWQPYGPRVERAQKFKNYIPDGEGGQRMCEMPGGTRSRYLVEMLERLPHSGNHGQPR